MRHPARRPINRSPTGVSPPVPGILRSVAIDADTAEWDIIVIGGGPPGENAAQYAIAGSDRTAVIIEKELVGGECSYWACMPSKALLIPVELARRARAVPGVAELVADGPPRLDAVLARRDGFAAHHDDAGQVAWADGAGIDVIRGHGRLIGERTVQVRTPDGGDRTLIAREAVIIATGTTAAIPAIPGMPESLPWTSRDVTNMHQLPPRVAIIGGGVVACEAATWLIGLGAHVTVLSSGDLLARNEPFAGRLVADALRDAGADVRLGATVRRVSRERPVDTGSGHIHGGPARIDWESDGQAGQLTVDEVVVATGRVPASADVGLESIGIDARGSGGYIAVDDSLTVRGVGGGWLYAIGDVNGRALLTHMGKYQGRVVGAVIAARARGAAADGPEHQATGPTPQVTFTDPSVASVGETERQARARGAQVETVEYDVGQVAGAALARDGYVGRAKLVIDAQTDLILGATFVGPDVADIVHAATVAMVGSVPTRRLWHAVPSYPTVSEIWLRLLETLAEQRAAAALE